MPRRPRPVLGVYSNDFAMLDGLYSNGSTTERASRSWLKEPISAFLRDLAQQGFKRATLTAYASWLLRLGEFAEQQGIQDAQQLPALVKPLLAGSAAQELHLKRRRSLLTKFLRRLVPGNSLPTPAAAPFVTCPLAAIVEEYTTFLRDYRGLCDRRICNVRRHCLKLVAFLTDEHLPGFLELNPQVIRRFLTREGLHCCRPSLQACCSSLRGFLAFLHRRGLAPADWSSTVESPRVYRQEQCPRFPTRPEVEAVLAAVDRSTLSGRRDYAMLLLLAVYGLRGSEVLRLRLDAIDWRQEKLHIRRRKVGNSTTYPLAASVGDALVTYLKSGRPASAHPEVFLTVLPPFRPMHNSASLTVRVYKYLRLAGVQVERPGAHTFRYSCAQRLLDQGLSLKDIGDYLGHRHPESTQGYTKIALDQLREVAAGDAEDLL